MPWFKQVIGFLLIPAISATIALAVQYARMSDGLDTIRNHEIRIRSLELENARLSTLVKERKP